MADLIDRVGDLPFEVLPPLAGSGRALWLQGVLSLGQAVFDRITWATTDQEQAAVLRGIPCLAPRRPRRHRGTMIFLLSWDKSDAGVA